MLHQFIRALALWLLLWVNTGTTGALAQGCAMCQTVMPHADEPIARGMLWCVSLLLAAPFAVAATIGGWLLYQYRATTISRQEGRT